MEDYVTELRDTFLEEASMFLEEIEQGLLELEGSSNVEEEIVRLFRSAHNLKGSSRSVGFNHVSEVTHKLEDILLLLKSNTIPVTSNIINAMLDAKDLLLNMIDELKSNHDAEFDVSASVNQLVAAKEEAEGSSSGNESAETVEEQASEPEDQGFHFFEDDEPSGDVQPEAPVQEVQPVETAAAPVAKKEAKKETKKADESLRVSLEKIESLNNFVGELVIMQTVLSSQAETVQNQLLASTVSQLRKISKEIQDISMSLRMIPLKQTFARMKRIVRDTAQVVEKDVVLNLEGEDIEVDKNVLESLTDPLVHIVRNAVDHGLEAKDERADSGKGKDGNITLKAYYEGSFLVIEVKDDGKGLNPQVLREKAIEKGILGQGEKLDDQKAIELILHPGFSTKANVSEISGRGVGMDVVNQNIKKLSGNLYIESELGSGSTFKIKLPLTLAIIEGLITRVGEETFVVPLSQIAETVTPKQAKVHSVENMGEILEIRGETIPLFRVGNLLGVKTEPQPSDISIIVRKDEQKFAVMFNDIVGRQQVVIKKLGPEVPNSQGYVGSAILGDGKPSLILELAELVGVDNIRNQSGLRRVG